MSNRVKEILEEKKRSGYWLAKNTSLSPQSIYNLMKRCVDIDDLRYGTLRQIAEALDIDIEEMRSG